MSRSAEPEAVRLSAALAYIKFRTGFSFSRRQFVRWCEQGLLTINGRPQPIASATVNRSIYIDRSSLDALVEILLDSLKQ